MDRTELQTLIDLALEDPEFARFSEAEEADGCCGLATDLFHSLIEDLGVKASLDEVHFMSSKKYLRQKRDWWDRSFRFRYLHTPHRWYRSGCHWDGHVAALVDGWIVDFTARQFDPAAPFPLVFRLDECLAALDSRSDFMVG